jgi:homoserine kinase
VRDVATRDIVHLHIEKALWIAIASPKHRLETRKARSVIPKDAPQAIWVAQMANTAALVHAFEFGDLELLRRSLDDRWVEQHRAPLVPHFAEVKASAMKAGALGCSISGAGPSVFALTTTQAVAKKAAAAMQKAFGPLGGETHVGQIAKTGAAKV